MMICRHVINESMKINKLFLIQPTFCGKQLDAKCCWLMLKTVERIAYYVRHTVMCAEHSLHIVMMLELSCIRSSTLNTKYDVTIYSMSIHTSIWSGLQARQNRKCAMSIIFAQTLVREEYVVLMTLIQSLRLFNGTLNSFSFQRMFARESRWLTHVWQWKYTYKPVWCM